MHLLIDANLSPRVAARLRDHGHDAVHVADIGLLGPTTGSAVSTARRLTVRFRGQVTPVPGGCQLAVHTELRPSGVLRVLSPLLRPVMRRSWEKDPRAIKTITER